MKQEEKNKLLQYENKYVVYQITFPIYFLLFGKVI